MIGPGCFAFSQSLSAACRLCRRGPAAAPSGTNPRAPARRRPGGPCRSRRPPCRARAGPRPARRIRSTSGSSFLDLHAAAARQLRGPLPISLLVSCRPRSSRLAIGRTKIAGSRLERFRATRRSPGRSPRARRCRDRPRRASRFTDRGHDALSDGSALSVDHAGNVAQQVSILHREAASSDLDVDILRGISLFHDELEPGLGLLAHQVADGAVGVGPIVVGDDDAEQAGGGPGRAWSRRAAPRASRPVP